MKTLSALTATCIVALTLSACATTELVRGTSVPAWVAATPPPSSGFTYFVASGSDSNGRASVAEAHAARALADRITGELASSIGGQPTAQARTELARLRARIGASAARGSRVKGSPLTIAGRWASTDGGRLTVYLLARYSTAALEAEKARLRELDRVKLDSVMRSVREGDRLLAEGKAYAAAERYITAASGASTSAAEQDVREFKAAIEKAIAAVSSIDLEPLDDDLTAYLAEPFPRPFTVEASSRAGGSVSPLVGVSFRVSYPVPKSESASGFAQTRLHSDHNGKLTIRLPPPKVFGEQSVTVSLDLERQLASLLALTAPWQKELVAGLVKEIDSRSVVLHYTATSHAASVPTGVLVMDLDRAGGFIPEDDAASGIVGVLKKAGFDLLVIPPNRSVVGIDPADLVKILRNNFRGKIKRAIVGEAKISAFERSGENYIVKVTAAVEVADLASGQVLFSTNETKLARATDATSAITAAFKGLGASIGEKIRDRLH